MRFRIACWDSSPFTRTHWPHLGNDSHFCRYFVGNESEVTKYVNNLNAERMKWHDGINGPIYQYAAVMVEK